MRVTIREDRLTGGITEVDQKKYALLHEVWAGSGVRVANASWRSEMKRGGILWCPAFLDKTWLLTADPMTYREVGQSDDNNLYRADSNQLVDALKPFVASGHLGVGVLCAYGIRPRTQQQFWDFADEIVRQTGKEINITSCWVPHHGANRNLAAVLCSGFALPENWLPYGLNPGR